MKLNIVPARTGVQWARLGMETFMKQPLALAALVFMYSTIAVAMLIIPVIGPFLMMGLVPMGTLGLMAATKVAETRAFPMPAVLLTAFRASRDRVRAMFVLGALYAASLMVIALVVSSLISVPTDKGPAEAVESPEFRLLMLASAVLYLPVSLAFWHAPALVHWHGVPPLKSLFFSFVACIRNMGAFTMYGLTWLGVIVVILAASALATALSPWFGGVVFGAASTLASIAFYISIWFTFRDSFIDTDTSREANDDETRPARAQ
jgi:hypothetical protein